MAKDSLSIIFIGNTDGWMDSDTVLPKMANTKTCSIQDLTHAFFAEYRPDIVLSPLVTSQFDVLELAIKLDQLNFEGRFRAITAPLPAPEIILSEIRFECPALDFDLIVLQPGQNLRTV